MMQLNLKIINNFLMIFLKYYLIKYLLNKNINLYLLIIKFI